MAVLPVSHRTGACSMWPADVLGLFILAVCRTAFSRFAAHIAAIGIRAGSGDASEGWLLRSRSGQGLSREWYIAHNRRAFAHRKGAFLTTRPHLLVIGTGTTPDFENVMVEIRRISDFEIVYHDDAFYCECAAASATVEGLMVAEDLMTWLTLFKDETECWHIDLPTLSIADAVMQAALHAQRPRERR